MKKKKPVPPSPELMRALQQIKNLPDPMNTKAEQIEPMSATQISEAVCEEWRNNVPRDENNAIMEMAGLPMLYRAITTALIQYSTEQNKELVEGLEKIKLFALTTQSRDFGTVLGRIVRLCIDAGITAQYPEIEAKHKAAALLAQHSEKGEK